MVIIMQYLWCCHHLTYEDAIEMALDKPLWGLLAASGAIYALMVHAE